MKAYAVGPDGTRQLIEASSIVIEMEEGKEVEIELNPAEGPFAGKLSLLAGTASQAIMAKGWGKKSAAIFSIEPGSANVLHIGLQIHQ